MGDVVEQSLASAVGQRITRLRLALNEAFVDGDIAGFLELAQMNACIAVGGLDRVADGREVDLSGTREKGNDGDPNAALQHLVDRIVVEVDHTLADAGWPRHSSRPGNASSNSIRTADRGSTSMRWRSA